MDFIFHGATGLIVSKGLTGEYLKSGFVFAILPDLLRTAPYEYLKLKICSRRSLRSFTKDFIMKYKKTLEFFSRWDRLSYRTTHTFLILPLVVILAWILFRHTWWVLVLCYLSHFAIDAFTHEGELAFRPFFPLSDFRIRGKSWEFHKGLYALFWLLLLITFIVVESLK